MELFTIDKDEFDSRYDVLLNEWKDFSLYDYIPPKKNQELLAIFSSRRNNAINVSNSVMDVINFLITSKILMDMNSKDEGYWYFYYQHNVLNFLHNLDDLLYNFVYEWTESYSISKEIGFRKNLINHLKDSDDKLKSSLAQALNSISIERTKVFRDENTHNVKSYRNYIHTTTDENGITYSGSLKSLFISVEEFENDFNHDVKKLLKKFSKVKSILGEHIENSEK